MTHAGASFYVAESVQAAKAPFIGRVLAIDEVQFACDRVISSHRRSRLDGARQNRAPGHEPGRQLGSRSRRIPSTITVVTLADTHGLSACLERWSWLCARTMSSLIRAGRKQIERRNGSR